jgi:hypothetical protein
MNKFQLLTVCVVACSGIAFGQVTPKDKGLQAITTDVLKGQLGFLASEWTEGRGAGEKGDYLSSDYIASILKIYGVKPGGDPVRTVNKTTKSTEIEKSYFQNFTILKTTPGEEQVFKIKSTEGSSVRTTSFKYGIDFYLRPTVEFESEAPVAFIGYGFKNDKLKFNDFSKNDIRGKYIIKISGVPAFAKEALTEQELNSISIDFINLAKAGGAAGIIDVNVTTNILAMGQKDWPAIMSPAEISPRSLISNSSFSIPGKTVPEVLPRFTVSLRAANEILKGTGIAIEDYIKKADSNLPYNIPPVAGKTVCLKTSVNTSAIAVHNIIGVIEGNDLNQVIVVGAHYDHMGMNEGYIWNGADDNGSGTVGVMTIAKAIKETGIKPDKTIVIALWTAEEEGLLGSRYWIQNPTFPLKNVKLNINFDMISRYITDNDPKKVTMTYSLSNPGFRDITEVNLKKYNIDLLVDYQPSSDPPGGTDHRSFVAAGIPVIRFKPGHREEYHTPADELSTIDWDIMEKIIKINFADTWDLATSSW